LVEAVLGPIVEVDAESEIRWPIVKLTETGEQSARETADYFGIVGKTRSGAAFAARLEAGVPPENIRFIFKVTGADGWLSLTSNHPYGFQAGDLQLTSSIAFDEPVPAAVPDSFVAASINVGQVYAQLVRDLHAGTYKTPGFQHALHNARLIEAVKGAAELGQRQKVKHHPRSHQPRTNENR
jgi:predicted dehydrogenase